MNCWCKCDSRKCKVNQKRNDGKSQCEYKNSKKHHVWKKDYVWNPSPMSCEIDEYF